MSVYNSNYTGAEIDAAIEKVKTGDIIHYITNPSGTAGSTTSGEYNRTQWTGGANGVTALYTGLVVYYKIPVAGCKYGTTLDINSLGEHPVVKNVSTAITTTYAVDAIIPLIYDAEQATNVYIDNVSTEITGCWKIADYDKDTTYSPATLGFGYGECTTAAATVAKAVTIASYALVVGGIVSVKFNNGISVANATLNIRSKGAKPIHYKGAALGANVIQANDTVVMQYDGTSYNIVSIIRNAGTPYNEVSYDVETISTSGSVALNGTIPLHVVAATADITAVTLSTNPTAGHACHVIFTATAARTVTIAYDATNRVTPKATNVTLNIPANGYVEVNFLSVGGKVYVRGV